MARCCGALLLLAALPALAQKATDSTVVTLRPGDDRVDSSFIKPGQRVSRAVRIHPDGRRELRGIWITEVEFVTVAGEKRVRLLTYSLTDDFPLRRWDVHASADTLEPLFYEYRELGRDNDVPELSGAEFRRHRHQGTRMTIEESDGDGGVRSSTREISGSAFDANLYGLLISAMPLADGFKARFPVVHAESPDVSWRTLDVVERRKVPVGIDGIKQDAWIVKVGQLTYWVLSETHSVIRVEDERLGVRTISEVIDAP